MSDEELVKLIQQGENINNGMEQLYMKTKGFINHCAKKYKGFADMEELMQEGYIALDNAVKAFDNEKYERFIFCLQIYLSRQFEKYYIENNRSGMISKGYNSYISRYLKIQKFFKLTFNRDPNMREYVAYLRLSVEMVKKIEDIMNMRKIVSIDAPISGDEDEKLCFGMTLSDSENVEVNVTDTMMDDDIKSGLWEIVRSNTNKEEYSVIWAIYTWDMPLDKYAKQTGISRKVVTNNRNSALSKLRAYKIKKMIADRYEINYAQAFRSSITSFKNTFTSSTERAAIKNVENELSYISFVLSNTVDGMRLLSQVQISLAFENRLIDDDFNICTKWEKPKQGFAMQEVEQYNIQGIMIKRWDHAMDAAGSLNISVSNIQRCCMGRRISAGGFIWKIVNK